MAGDVGSAMGIGGSGGLFSRKTELVADLTSAFKTLNAELTKTRDLSAQIAKNMKGSFPGGGGDGGNLLENSLQQSTGTQTPEGDTNNGSSNILGKLGAVAKIIGGIGKIAGGLTMGAMGVLPSVNDTLDAQTLTGQVGAAMGGGYGGARSRIMQMMGQGTYMNMNDAAQAAMSGGAYGQSMAYGNAAKSYNALSLFSPGMSGGQMASTVTGMNQGANVNMARIIGINIRDKKGMMRPIPDIVNDLWKYLEANKRSAGAITPFDLDESLQPGGALDSILNTYFSGTDANTRTAIVNMLRAKAMGAPLTKAGAMKSGINNANLESGAAREASKYGSGSGGAGSDILSGYRKANTAISDINNAFEKLSKNPLVKMLLEGKGFMDTMGANGGGGLIAAGGAALALGAGGIFKAGKGIVNWFKDRGKSAEKLVEKEGKQIGKEAKNIGKEVAKYGEEGVSATEEALPAIEEGVAIAGEETVGAVADTVTFGGGTVAATALAAGTAAWFAKQQLDKKHKKDLEKKAAEAKNPVKPHITPPATPKVTPPPPHVVPVPANHPAATAHIAPAVASHVEKATPQAHAAATTPAPHAGKSTPAPTKSTAGSVVNNYGGVTININGTGKVDPKQLAADIKTILDADNIRAKAMGN